MKIRQHEAIRVPQGWSGQEKTLIIQLENIFNDLYRLSGQLGSLMVTNISFNTDTNTLSMVIDGEGIDIAKLASLDGNGKVPASQLPSYVDDVEEYADSAHFPATGETGKIYVAIDTGLEYRWSGSVYSQLSKYEVATQNASGLMSASDKTKLDGVAEGATANIGTITSVKVNGETVSTSGEADVGTVIRSHQDISGKADKVSNPTENNFAALDSGGNLKDSGHKHSDYLTEHQDISGKADKSTTVTSVDYDTVNKKITKTINGSTTDVVSVSTMKSDLGAFTWGQLANQ